jgi:hypothetical protein
MGRPAVQAQVNVNHLARAVGRTPDDASYLLRGLVIASGISGVGNQPSDGPAF